MWTSTSATSGLAARIASFTAWRDAVAVAHGDVGVHADVDVHVELEAHLADAAFLHIDDAGDAGRDRAHTFLELSCGGAVSMHFVQRRE